MSSVSPPEFFFDRSLGKITAQRLRDAGCTVHLIADFYPTDAKDIPDETWIAEGCSRGWVLLTKDQRIRYRAAELASLQEGHLFCLASGNMNMGRGGSSAARPASWGSATREVLQEPGQEAVADAVLAGVGRGGCVESRQSAVALGDDAFDGSDVEARCAQDQLASGVGFQGVALHEPR